MEKFRLIIAAVMVSAWAIVPVSAQQANDAFGVWKHPDNGSHIRISKCGGGLCAKIIKVLDTSRKDEYNPDPAKRKRPIKGIIIVNGAKKASDTKWSGKIYNTQNGKTYDGSLTVISKNKLKLEGCVLGGLLCQGTDWTRVN